MLKRIGKLVVVVLVFALIRGPMGLPSQGGFRVRAGGNDDKPERITRNDVNVRDYPLDALIQRVYVDCDKKLIVAEPLPGTKVVLVMTGGFDEYNKLLSGKFGLVFQPVQRVNGQFQTGGTYESSALSDTNTWIVCLADGSSLGEGKVRLYKDKGQYLLTTNAASIKDIIKQVDSLFGNESNCFAKEVTQQLFLLGIDLSKPGVDVSLSLKKTFSDFGKFLPDLWSSLSIKLTWLQGTIMAQKSGPLLSSRRPSARLKPLKMASKISWPGSMISIRNKPK
jgi:hypothetical protein